MTDQTGCHNGFPHDSDRRVMKQTVQQLTLMREIAPVQPQFGCRCDSSGLVIRMIHEFSASDRRVVPTRKHGNRAGSNRTGWMVDQKFDLAAPAVRVGTA